GTVPAGVGEVEERGAVGMSEIVATGRNLDHAMPVQRVSALVGGTREGTRLAVQAGIGWLTVGGVGPRPDLVGAEARPPRPVPVPERRGRVPRARRRHQLDAHLHRVHGITVGFTAL